MRTRVTATDEEVVHLGGAVAVVVQVARMLEATLPARFADEVVLPVAAVVPRLPMLREHMLP